MLLQIERLDADYGGLVALSGVSLSVDERQFVTVLGANGAGKSTLFKAISGVIPYRGRILFKGRDLSTVPAWQRASLGIAHVPEGRRVFRSMTVHENILVGARAGRQRGDEARAVRQAIELFPRLQERVDQLAGTLSGGEQQMLALARGLASSPELLLLDEPSMGLSPRVTDAIFEAVLEIRRSRGVTILLVEQRIAECIEACDRGYLLETGRVVLEGAPQVLRQDPRVRQAYLGR